MRGDGSRREPVIVHRFDKNAVTFFSRKDGTKLRFAVGSYVKAKRPELVDIKITDWCDVGCSFCYQDSTLQGRHASMSNMELVVERLAGAKVFEVALGGGETTGHPGFARIVHMFRDAGVVPNFTTKKPAAVRRLWDEVGDEVGGFAYSAETGEQVRSAARLLRDVPVGKASLHYVMGLGDREHFVSYLSAAAEVGWRVTLLGYKTTGRGKQVVPYPYEWWVDAVDGLIREGRCPSLSVDTPLAEQFDGRMPVASHMYHTREGAFSMYVDAVAMRMGASSFDDTVSLVPFDDSWVSRYRVM